jgi:hypothetical protein
VLNKKKAKIKPDGMERRILVKLLYASSGMMSAL